MRSHGNLPLDGIVQAPINPTGEERAWVDPIPSHIEGRVQRVYVSLCNPPDQTQDQQ